MKKLVIIAISLFAFCAFSDIAVDWYHDGYTGDENGTWDTDALTCQLIWSDSSPSGIASVGASLLEGEHLLDSTTAVYGSFSSDGSTKYLDSVLGLTLADGYLYARVWNAEQTWYYQSASLTSLTSAGDPVSASEIIDANLLTDRKSVV